MRSLGFTEQALNDIAAVCDSAQTTPSLERSFINLLCYGIGGIRDRPLHDLCSTMLALGRAYEALGSTDVVGLEVLAKTPTEIWTDLSNAALISNSGLSFSDENRISLEVSDEKYEISQARLKIHSNACGLFAVNG